MTDQKCILIVEDEQPLAKALEIKLNKVGFTAESVFNGEDAISQLEKKHYDLMLLDLLMPGIDGFEVLEKIQGKKVPVIITSNLSQSEDIKKAKALGAVDFIVKSNASLQDIVSAVSTYVSTH